MPDILCALEVMNGNDARGHGFVVLGEQKIVHRADNFDITANFPSGTDVYRDVTASMDRSGLLGVANAASQALQTA
ncbi:MAG TPA: hypothetical protein VK752_12760 [Bryobacteraceae bacterium]|nr:hypothetical protein [Bryobacteraceae bacterium]